MIENREETKKGKKEGREGEKEGEKEKKEGEKKENERKLYRVMRWTSKVGTGGRLGVGDANPDFFNAGPGYISLLCYLITNKEMQGKE